MKGAGREGVGGFTCLCTFPGMFCLLEMVRVKYAGKSEEARLLRTDAYDTLFYSPGTEAK